MTRHKSKTPQKPSTHSKGRDSGLSVSDRDLIFMVTDACNKVGCVDFVQEVFSLPSDARGQLQRILEQLLHPNEPLTPGKRHQLAARLHLWAEAVGLDPDIADAFLIDKDQWEARYVVALGAAS
jgi:hypothetical protein